MRKNKQVTLTKELAQAMYNFGSSEFKELILSNFNELEFAKEPISAEQRFLDIWSGCILHPGRDRMDYFKDVCLMKNGRCMFLYDINDNYVSCNSIISDIFEYEYNFTYTDFCTFVSAIHEKYFNRKIKTQAMNGILTLESYYRADYFEEKCDMLYRKLNKDIKHITLDLYTAKQMYRSVNPILRKVAIDNYTEAELIGVPVSYEQQFLDMWFGCTVYYDKEQPNSICLMRDDICIFKQNFSDDSLWCEHKTWIKLKSITGSEETTTSIIKDALEKRIKWQPKIIYSEFSAEMEKPSSTVNNVYGYK